VFVRGGEIMLGSMLINSDVTYRDQIGTCLHFSGSPSHMDNARYQVGGERRDSGLERKRAMEPT